MRKLTQEQRIKAENAELIAKFEGYEVITENGHRVIIYSDDNERTAIDTYYESSWDWLMPVISKIYDTAEGEQGREEDLIGDITHRLVDVDIDETYKSVVEFIKWFNKKNNII